MALLKSVTKFCPLLISRTRITMAQGQPLTEELEISAPVPENSQQNTRVFDFKMFNHRHIALCLAYLGADYHGFAIQDPPQVTIESCLFEVLLKTKLIEDKNSCDYSRCGRTDAGVSALGQVVSLKVRSNLLEGPGVVVPEDSKAHTRKGDKTTELPYMTILNRNLPNDIRVVSWATVDSSFNARFSCKERTYKYFFPRGNIDLEAMQTAAQSFLGEHDFRNFCKMNIRGGVTNFRRMITRFDVEVLDDGGRSLPSPYQMCVATISGKAFLMHQVRCMMGILFLVGNGLEHPSVVTHILDLQLCPRKPQYGMASPEPLVLFDSQYEGIEWKTEERMAKNVVAHFQQMWTRQAVKTVMIRQMTDYLSSTSTPSNPPSSHLAPLMFSDHKLGSSTYKPLFKRPTSATFEERYVKHKRKKLLECTDEEREDK